MSTNDNDNRKPHEDREPCYGHRTVEAISEGWAIMPQGEED